MPTTPGHGTESPEDGEIPATTRWADYLTEDDIPDYKLQENNRSRDERPEEIPFSDSTSFYETLKEQLGEHDLSEHQRTLAEYLIGSLDDDGLLRKSLDSISDELAIYAGIETTPQELEEALHVIQSFDPARTGRAKPARVPLDTNPPQDGATAERRRPVVAKGRRKPSWRTATKNSPANIGTRYSKSSASAKTCANRPSAKSAG